MDPPRGSVWLLSGPKNGGCAVRRAPMASAVSREENLLVHVLGRPAESMTLSTETYSRLEIAPTIRCSTHDASSYPLVIRRQVALSACGPRCALRMV